MAKRKLVAYLGLSLDGYIATLDESVAWLEAVEGEGDNGYGDFYASIDTVLMGRATYDWIDQRMVPYPYSDKANYVFTTREAKPRPGVTFVNGKAAELVADLKEQPGQDIWLCGGGGLFSQLLAAGQVDQLRLTIAPIILGQGISLYQDLLTPTELVLDETRRHKQFIELIYSVKKENRHDIDG